MFKGLEEKRAELKENMENLLSKADEEKRAMTDEESKEFDDLEKSIQDIDKTIAALERSRKLKIEQQGAKKDTTKSKEKEESDDDETGESEVRAFDDYIRGVVSEERATNLTTGDNGAVIPTSIANKIIQKVYDISPIYQLATRYNVKGNLNIPYYDETEGAIRMDYATEFVDLESSSGKFASIELKGFLAGVITLISKSLVNNSQFDVVNFVVNKMAENIAKWIENEMLNGTDDKIDGISKCKQVVPASSANAIAGDDLIDLQEAVPDRWQPKCIWIMNKATRTLIRKIKDADGNYILNKDATAKWGYTLFGNDVYCSDNAPKIAPGTRPIAYGDFSGIALKVSADMDIEVLRERYAPQHAIGVVGWIEIDSKIEDEQKIAVLEMGA